MSKKTHCFPDRKQKSLGDPLHTDLWRFLSRFPDFYNHTLLNEKNLILSKIDSLYCSIRSQKHIGRIIRSLHIIHHDVTQHASFQPSDRHIHLSTFPALLSYPFSKKEVVGMTLGLNFLTDHEQFTFKHIQSALQACFPDFAIVSNSTIVFKDTNKIKSFYFELETSPSSDSKIKMIRSKLQLLKTELKKRIESLVPELFMPRNEEEIMRTIFALSKEVTQVNDIPQIAVSLQFYNQTELSFSAVVLRVLTDTSNEIHEDLFSTENCLIEIERTQVIKYIDQSIPVEMLLITIKFHDLTPFQRANFSIHIPDARKKVLNILQTVLGDVRDYNGGLLLKQNQAFEQLKEQFPHFADKHSDILETFFYSISPIEFQATLSTEELFSWFTLISKNIKNNASQEAKLISSSGEKWDNLLIYSPDRSIIKSIKKDQKKYPHLFTSCVSTSFTHDSCLYLSFLVPTPHALYPFLNELIQKWNANRKIQYPLSIQIVRDLSLDPRIGGDTQSTVHIKMLFEGLFRKDSSGKVHPAIALSYKISKDQKLYTFYLRETQWSNGTPLKASDFEYSWKKILDPYFKTPFAYLFDPILNTKKAKEGVCNIHEVGINALDDHTLEVVLETPCSFFLETLTHPTFFPVNEKNDQLYPDWPNRRDEFYVCNGPYKPIECRPFYAFEFKKNRFYWDDQRVKISHVVVSNAHEKGTFKLFQEGKIDWLGSPISRWEPDYKSPKHKPSLYPSSKTLWITFNCSSTYLDCNLFRNALSYAIRRKDLFSSHFYNPTPAFSPLSEHHSFFSNSLLKKLENRSFAQACLKKSLEKINVKLKNLPVFIFTIFDSDLLEEVAIKLTSQWKEVLGLEIQIERVPFSQLFPRLVSGDFQIGSIRWTAWINDPMYTLNPFIYKHEKINFSKWENSSYQNMMLKAKYTDQTEEKNKFLKKAEKILIDASAVIPIFYEPEFFLKHPRLSIALPKNEGGVLDFSFATINK